MSWGIRYGAYKDEWCRRCNAEFVAQNAHRTGMHGDANTRLRSMLAVVRAFAVLGVAMCLVTPSFAQKAKIPPPAYPEWEDWSLISSRKPSNARLASHTLPHAEPYVQGSYTWDNFVPQVHNKHKNLAYGNVLNGHREYVVKGRGKNTTAEYAGIISALEFALKAVVPAISNSIEAQQYWPNVTTEALQESLHVTDYVLNQALVQPLRFTIDGRTHLAVDAEIPVSDRKLERKKHKPTFGIRFYLKITAHVALHGGFPVPSHHTVIVFYDMARMFFMNTHSFYVGEPPHLRRITEASIDDGGVITSRNIAVDGDDVSVCVYNVWNSNPPSWLFHGYDRWKRYWLRMQLLADTIRAESPALITFQACVDVGHSRRLSSSCAYVCVVSGGAVRHHTAFVWQTCANRSLGVTAP
jgi:hypothetical protein